MVLAYPENGRGMPFAVSDTLVVAADGTGDYRTVQAALDAVPAGNQKEVVVYIKNGVYSGKLHLDSTRPHVTMIGEDEENTILTWSDHPGMVLPNGDSVNTRNSHSFLVQAADFSARRLTIRNDAGFTAGQAVALEVQGDRASFFDCGIIGNQDILFLNSAGHRQYFRDCYIEGTTDFIFGGGLAWFENCHIHSKKNSHVTAASTAQSQPYGFIFDHCVLTGDSTVTNASLGRPWQPYASVSYLHCYIGRHIRPEGWSAWNKLDTYALSRFSEFEDYGPGATVSSRVSWSHQLTAEDARRITPGNIFNDWFPEVDWSWSHLPVITRPVFKKDSFSIIAYGAVADGVRLNTAAINAAIEDCSRKGGGVVVVPPGLWVTGPVVLRSHVDLYVSRAAILQFTADHDRYPIVVGNWEGHPAARCQSPLSGTDLEDVAITGTGIIDGNGDGWRWVRKDSLTDREWRVKVASGGVVTEDGKTWFPSGQSLKGFRTKGAGVVKPGMTASDFADIKDFLRPNLLVLTNCKRVLLDGPSFQNSAAWCLHTLLCEDLTVRDVHVRNPSWAVNGDALDVESCRDVLIENSTFDAGDDGICVKSGRDEDGRRRGRPTENMIVRNNIVYRGHGGFVVGSEMSGGVRNIFVSDCSFIGTDIGLRFKTVRGRGGVVEKIFVKNISMRNIGGQAIFLDMYYFAKPPSIAEIYAGRAKDSIPPVTEATPQFRDIHISNVVCDGAEEGIFVRGLPEMNIRDIYLDDMVLKAAKGVELTEAQEVHLKDIRLVTSESDPVIYVENSSQLTFDHISYNPGAVLLFSINGEKCSAIRVRDTDGSKAVRSAAFQYGAVPKTLELN